MEVRFDHIGIAVPNLETAIKIWESTLKVRATPPEIVESQSVRVSFLEAGEAHLELLEPTSPDSPVGKFLTKRGEGIHHVAFHVSDLAQKLEELRSLKVELIDQIPRKGARGAWVAFAKPSSMGGVLTEFVHRD